MAGTTDGHGVDSACKDVVVRLLDKDERTRLGSRSGASEVKQHKWFAKINWGLLRNTRPPVGVPLFHNGVVGRWDGHSGRVEDTGLGARASRA